MMKSDVKKIEFSDNTLYVTFKKPILTMLGISISTIGYKDFPKKDYEDLIKDDKKQIWSEIIAERKRL